ncbi:hypothetical protein JKF63_00458 [Porcisia hertigi]|uniref:tRNA-uridine aminocarboxypropyltransferase n=1 Tax=Porcisia hertigi TaxID=2761500 RepID=A0A836HZ37_9TRYP|nr:hypothetical protein JKF63_00458 [Porcisia hertigi]
MIPATSPTSAAVHSLSEPLVSSCEATSNPYKRSMLRLLEYVGLKHYGTPRATMPSRTSEQADRIAQHLNTVTEKVRSHKESLQRRNIHINKRKLTNDMMRVMEWAATPLGPAVSAGDQITVKDDSAAMSSGQPEELLPTIYLSFEESVEWKAFLASVKPEDRHAVTVMRRLSVELWRAHKRDLCLWCWFPRSMCMCDELDAYRATLPAGILDQHVEVTMLLHSEELMRSTNSGHIAAYLFGAPLRVWGLADDDVYLRQLLPVEHRPAGCSAEESATVYHVSLYPSSDAVTIHDYIWRAHLRRSPLDSVCGEEEEAEEEERSAGDQAPVIDLGGDGDGADVQVNAIHTTPRSLDAVALGNVKEGSVAPHVRPSTTAGDALHSRRKVHLILLDSTWGQALSLNRHITRQIPRVSLEISEDYDSLFQALRKRTREACVSTLEATNMAVVQCVRAMGYAEEAASTSQTLIDAMKRFVDARCLLKNADAQFTTNVQTLHELRDRRDDVCRRDAARRQEALAVKMQSDEAARRLRLPPVLNYCYCCDRVIGWHRMPEHVMGHKHRTALELNPSCTPSAKSATVVVPDFSRPRRLAGRGGGGDERTAMSLVDNKAEAASEQIAGVLA